VHEKRGGGAERVEREQQGVEEEQQQHRGAGGGKESPAEPHQSTVAYKTSKFAPSNRASTGRSGRASAAGDAVDALFGEMRGDSQHANWKKPAEPHHQLGHVETEHGADGNKFQQQKRQHVLAHTGVFGGRQCAKEIALKSLCDAQNDEHHQVARRHSRQFDSITDRARAATDSVLLTSTVVLLSINVNAA
jgi:hypothetical protein